MKYVCWVILFLFPALIFSFERLFKIARITQCNCNFGDYSIENMTVDEIVSELSLRGINYDDCTKKTSLINRLKESRATGRADPSILDKFNASDMEEALTGTATTDSSWVDSITSSDGTLPGGLSPEVVKLLTSDGEIMSMMKDPKMQDILKSVMKAGPEGMKKYLSDSGNVGFISLEFYNFIRPRCFAAATEAK